MSKPMVIEVQAYEALEKTVKASGNSGRIYAPKEWVGKKVKILLLEPLGNKISVPGDKNENH